MKDLIITSDTDSAFFHVKDIVLKRNPNIDLNNREEVIPVVLQIANDYQAMANKFIGDFAKSAFNLGDNEPHYFELKQEVVLERGYFAGKRRYAQFIVNKEGVPTEELDMKGLDLMKSNFPPLFKNFGENLIQQIMFGKTKSEIDKEVLEFRDLIRTIDWKKILKPTGLKKLREYIDSPPRAGEIFSKLKTKCPINTKAAIYANDLIRFKKLDKKYSLFQPGDKIYICYLKNNPYKIDVVALNGYNDPPELLEFAEKYLDKDGLFEGVMQNKIEGLYSDLSWGKPIFNEKINRFFSFG